MEYNNPGLETSAATSRMMWMLYAYHRRPLLTREGVKSIDTNYIIVSRH